MWPVAEDAPVEVPSRASAWRRLLELFVLCAFAVAQPLLDVTGRSPETFIFYRVDGAEVVAFALILVLVPPLVLWVVVAGLALVSATVGRVAHAVIAGGLIALTVLQATKKVSDLRGPLIVVVAVALAVGAVYLFARSEAARRFVTYLTPAPLLFALLFLIGSPVGDLVRSPDGERTANRRVKDVGAAPPVVMILLDEFPLSSLLNSQGRVDERVFPNFARLAETSDWYRNGTAVSPFTQYAVPSVLTGRYPETKLAPSYLAQPDNLFSLLAADYRIRSFEMITQLCDPALCDDAEPASAGRGLSDLFARTWQVAKDLAKPYDVTAPISDQFSEESAGGAKGSPALTVASAQTKPNWKSLRANQPDRFQRFIDGLRSSDEPTMHFLHLLLPHHHWRHLPSGATHPAKLLGGVKGGWGRYAWPLEVNRQAHLLQVAYTDRLLGEAIDRMEQQGIWDDALVVVTADHGESFIPGTSGRRLSEEAEHAAAIAWVPVFIKQPGQLRGTTNDANWEQVDLLPTVADALGLEVTFKVDGISHVSGNRARRTKYFYNNPGERITFPGGPAFRFALEGVTDTLVRGSEGQAGLYVTGSRPDWIGRSVSSLVSLGVSVDGERSPMIARLWSEIDFRTIDPSSGRVPALVSGTLSSSAGRGPVVIAVNGTVAAVSEIWPESGQPSFAGMVNDGLFVAGDNELALYEVVGGTNPQLRQITVRGR